MEVTNEIVYNSYLEKTKTAMTRIWGNFENWRGNANLNERTLLEYITEASESKAPTTLWTELSLIVSEAKRTKGVDLGEVPTIKAFLKAIGKKHKKKQSKAFTKTEIMQYLKEEPEDNEQLYYKVVLVLGYYGALRMAELVEITFENISTIGNGYNIYIVRKKTDKANIRETKYLPRLDGPTCPCRILEKYMNNFTKLERTGWLLRRYWLGKFTKNHIGINVISKIPSIIAKYLNLPEPNGYTGHSFRSSSATALVEAGASQINLKRHGGWKSDSIAESYIRNSQRQKVEIAEMHSKDQKEKNEMDERKGCISFNNCTFNGCHM